MSYKPVESIEVICWDKPVGVLAHDPRSGCYAFEYYPNFNSHGWELSPILLPASTRGAVVFSNLARETFFGLPAFIADSLPDNFGNLLINSWMATQGIRKEQITTLDRLAYMGKRAMGALEFRPALRAESLKPSALEMGELIEQARSALKISSTGEPGLVTGLVPSRQLPQRPPSPPLAMPPGSLDPPKQSHVPLDPPEQQTLGELIAIGTSAGGARAKAVVGYNAASGQFVSGQFGLPKGFAHWIIKFDIPSHEPGDASKACGRVEYAYHLMALACGINMQPSRVLHIGESYHFMTKRFDRNKEGKKLHMQTLCAMCALDFNVRETHDYHQAFIAVQDLGLGYAAIDELFLRMTFNVAMANNDDHTKNLAFIMDTDGVWQLAPAYDLTFVYNPNGLWTSRHLMSVNGKFQQISRTDLLVLARRYHVSSPDKLIDKVLEVADHWPDFAGLAGVPVARIEQISRDIQSCCQLLRVID